MSGDPLGSYYIEKLKQQAGKRNRFTYAHRCRYARAALHNDL